VNSESNLPSEDLKGAEALAQVLAGNGWEAVILAEGLIQTRSGATAEEVARRMFERGLGTLKRSRELAAKLREGVKFESLLIPRERTGSAANPITKLFPATITEQRFVELLDSLKDRRSGIDYIDERETGHKLTDFQLTEDDLRLHINVKNAGTPFRLAAGFVGLAPEDCLPIPAYKAFAAVESLPDLVYVVSVDYELIKQLERLLPELFSEEERLVWDLLNKYEGARSKRGEDMFVFSTVRKYWTSIRDVVAPSPFRVISAKKAVRILQQQPRRTPGLGLKAWGTGARAEVNVHVSIGGETISWDSLCDRIVNRGLEEILRAIGRKRVEEVNDPEF
jgi:hypothetical protein